MRDRLVYMEFIENFYYFQKSRKGYDKVRMLNSYKLARDEGYSMKELDNASDTIIRLLKRRTK